MEKLRINGKDKEFSDGLPATVEQLLEKLNIEAATVVAEIDGQIVEREKFSQAKLLKGQNIELIRFVPGG